MLEPRHAAAGEVLIREGEPGDLFYLVADGEVAVTTAAGFATTLRRGEGFGEIALLNNTPRTATVTASSDVSLYTLGRRGVPDCDHRHVRRPRRRADDGLRATGGADRRQ